MVTIITEKLRNQTLEDVQFEPINQVLRRPWESSSGSTFQFTGKKEWSLVLGGGAPSSSSSHLLVVGTPPDPPKKRHCRSLSIPAGDGAKVVQARQVGKKWQPQKSTVWKPVSPAGDELGPPSPEPTPPSSPGPRPASASSGFCSSSTTSLSSHHQPLRLRSISMEEPISSSRAAGGGAGPLAAAGMPERVRCRSQPCVLRSGGLKRRRGEEDSARPTLDFRKMKETAYFRLSNRVRHKSSQSTYELADGGAPPVRSVRSLASLYTGAGGGGEERFHLLDTIASSPLDAPPQPPRPHCQSPPPPRLPSPPPFSAASPPLTDSGCSEDEEESFVDAELEGAGGRDEELQVFQMDMNCELDLDQIEKD